jgi:hypothetical protein
VTSVAGRGTIVLGNDRDLQLAPDEETKARLAGLRMVRTITPLPAKLVGLSADRGGSRLPAVGYSPTPVGMLTILDTNLAAKGRVKSARGISPLDERLRPLPVRGDQALSSWCYSVAVRAGWIPTPARPAIRPAVIPITSHLNYRRTR